MYRGEIKVERTAVYHTLGTLGPDTRYIWLLLHGYGQTAEDFLERFRELDDGSHFLIAPEGLSRFYWEGFRGKPVASWMTRLHRDSEIADYIGYLDQLWTEIFSGYNGSARRMLLGFSQGVATASRWLHGGSGGRIDQFFALAGEIAREIDLDAADSPLRSTRISYLYGNADPFLEHAAVQLYQERLRTSGLEIDWRVFEGKHGVNQACLAAIRELMD